MAKKKFRVYIGRFSPFHDGHARTMISALSGTDHFLVLIGSSNQSRSLKNPFTYDERASIINNWYQEYCIDRDNHPTTFKTFPLEDNPYNDTAWITSVDAAIKMCAFSSGIDLSTVDVEIVYSSKEDASAYPHWFPQYGKFESVAKEFNGEIIAATMIRDLFFGDLNSWGDIEHLVPHQTLSFLEKFEETNAYDEVRDEFQFIRKYKRDWSVAPYAPTFVTVDAVVIQSGHILLIQRKNYPGKGLWALPGGFLDQSETLRKAAIRELLEETRLKVPEKVLEGSIVDSKVFDHPNRSERGRTITHAFYFRLKDEYDLPLVKGSDDAMDAKWVPLSSLQFAKDRFYEDHFHIIQSFL